MNAVVMSFFMILQVGKWEIITTLNTPFSVHNNNLGSIFQSYGTKNSVAYINFCVTIICD
jgi:transcription termination factor NusB